VPRKVFGKDPLPGTLVVDRYHAYNKACCFLQYCYAYLLRNVEDTENEFPGNRKVRNFVITLAPLSASAMNLRSSPIPDAPFYERAKEVKSHILKAVHDAAQHLAIRRIQEIFHENEQRLYQWAEDRQIPADNNLTERDLRPTVIARNVSFGSQSKAGANTRSVLMTVLHTLKKQNSGPCPTLKTAFDQTCEASPAPTMRSRSIKNSPLSKRLLPRHEISR
jgi:transposase